MKCIVKKAGVYFMLVCLLMLQTGCGGKNTPEQPYDIYSTTERYGLGIQKEQVSGDFFAADLCVGGNENILDENVTENIAQSAGLFSLQDNHISYARNIHDKLYPASTTKILTAYVAIKYGDLQATTTVSENALKVSPDSTVCGVSIGDKITLEQLLYGLMLCSGNDAANVIAEMISGSVDEFAELMNQEARALGATNSHFVNPHGLHDERHYTTAYDLYLIFQAAMEQEVFRQVINTTVYTTTFTNYQGDSIEKEWVSTNQYLRGVKEVPEGVTVIGGKTGTTDDAGYCLVLYSEGTSNNPYVSIVMNADSRDDLYYQMTELLEKISN